MKRKMTQKKTRYHFCLFCKDTPFRPKSVKNKKAYRRKNKHEKKEEY